MLTYLLINLFSILIPLIYSFHRKLDFYRTWYAFWPAMLLSGGIFILWDIVFTRWQVWGFNPKYLLGIDLFGLPIEEWLFFVCIPYACVFTYHCLNRLIKRDLLSKHTNMISWLLITVLLGIAFANLERLYTSTAFVVTAGLVSLHLFFLKSDYLGRFYVAYTVILIPFFVVNGLLTGSLIEEQVVWYNDAENLGVRVFTIPVEDFFYGLSLILINITFYETLMARKATTQHAREDRKTGRFSLSV